MHTSTQQPGLPHVSAQDARIYYLMLDYSLRASATTLFESPLGKICTSGGVDEKGVGDRVYTFIGCIGKK